MKTKKIQKKSLPVGLLVIAACAFLAASALLVSSTKDKTLAAVNGPSALSTAPQRGGLGGGGTTPTLQQVTDAGKTTTNGITLDQGNVNGGTVANGLAFGSGSGEVIGSKRTSGGNQWGIDFYTNFLNRFSITNSGNVGIGTTTPSTKLEVIGSVKITDGSQGAGKVLTSDANGVGSWQTMNVSGASASSQVVFTSTRYPYSTNRDTTCTSTFGSNYHSAMSYDLAMYATARTPSTFFAKDSGAANPHIVGSNSSGVLDIAQVFTNNTSELLPIVCVRNDAPILFTSGRYPYSTNRDTTCTSTFGSNYHSAMSYDLAMYATARTPSTFFAKDSGAANPHIVGSNSSGVLDIAQVFTNNTSELLPIVCVR